MLWTEGRVPGMEGKRVVPRFTKVLLPDLDMSVSDGTDGALKFLFLEELRGYRQAISEKYLAQSSSKQVCQAENCQPGDTQLPTDKETNHISKTYLFSDL